MANSHPHRVVMPYPSTSSVTSCHVLCCLPELLEVVELPELLAHEVDDDITAVDELPSIRSWRLMPVADFKAKLFKLAPELMHHTLQVSYR